MRDFLEELRHLLSMNPRGRHRNKNWRGLKEELKNAGYCFYKLKQKPNPINNFGKKRSFL